MLTALTMHLFRFVGMDISEFYFENVVLFGAAALAIVATYLVSRNLKLAKNIAPYIAKIFSPLVLAIVGLSYNGYLGGKKSILGPQFPHILQRNPP